MKINIRIVLMTLMTIVFFACQKTDLNDLLKGISPVSVNFVKSDSTRIIEGECINPYNKYLIAVTIDVKNETSGVAHDVHYTLNDSAFTISFTKSGKKYIPITLKEGVNKVQLTSTNLKDSLKAYYQEFELVN